MSDNALRDIIYGDPIGSESLVGMQSATPIYDQKTSFENMLRARGLPSMEDMSRIAMGFAGGVESPQFSNMADFIQLLRSLQMRLPTAESKGYGAIGVTPLGKSSPEVEFYQLPGFNQGILDSMRGSGEEYPGAYYTGSGTAEKTYDPLESALNRLMQRVYKGWE